MAERLKGSTRATWPRGQEPGSSGARLPSSCRGDGLRDSRNFDSNTTTFTWDIAAGLPVVIDDEGARYVYGAGLVSQVTSGESYYYLTDGIGSKRCVA